MQYISRMVKPMIAGMATAGLLVGCSGGAGGGSSSSTAAALSISGGFSGLSLVSPNGLYTPMAVTDYTMVCAMLVSPFTSDAKALASDGTFDLSISGGAGQPIGCFLTKSGAIAGVFEFETGSSESGSALPVNEGAKTITFPSNLSLVNGTVAVPVTSITQDSTTAPADTFVDPTGAWTISKVCMSEINETTGKKETQCMSPSQAEDMPSSVYMKLVTATDGTDTKTGLSIWASEADRNACGGKEGDVELPSGFTAVGGWDGAFTGGINIELNTTTEVDTAAAHAKVATWGGSTTFCGANQTTGAQPQPLVDGVTTCADVDWSSGGSWGMSDAACKLYCVTSAIGNGKNENGDSYFDWSGYATATSQTGSTCEKRYRMKWEYSNEFADDKDYDPTNNSGTPTPGALADGTCATTADGCVDGSVELLVPDERGPENRFMFGVFNIVGNIGTLIQKDHYGPNTYRHGNNDSIQCGGTHIEKMTMVQTSATKAQVTVEHNFIPDPTNDVECATNSDFMQNQDRDQGFTLQVSKQ